MTDAVGLSGQVPSTQPKEFPRHDPEVLSEFARPFQHCLSGYTESESFWI